MKFNLVKFTAIALSSLLFFNSCDKELSPTTLVGQQFSFDQLFEHVTNEIQVDDKEHALYIDFEYERGTNNIVVTQVEQKEPDFFVIYPHIESSRIGNYTVTCNDGDETWEEGCSGNMSCGKLVYKCLGQGGCATICEGRIIYIPPARLFVAKSKN